MLFLLCMMVGRERKLLRLMAAVFLGSIFGFSWFMGFRTAYLSPLDKYLNTEQPAVITASDYGQNTNYGTSVDGILLLEGKTYQIRTYLKDTADIHPGDRLEGIFAIRPAKREAATYFGGKGIFLFAHQKEAVRITESGEISLWHRSAVLREKIRSYLESIFPQDVAPFAKALLLGDSGELSYAVDTAFQISGIRHIIAVSGLHISILYGLVCVFTMRRRFLTALVGMPALLIFAAVAGFTPSVTRACVMVCLMMLAQIFNREYDPPTALAFSVLAMLAANPMAVTSASLQLSVSCVAGILLFHQSINNWLKTSLPDKCIPGKLRGTLCANISVTVSAMSLVTPLSAWYFGTVSLVGILTNLLTLWAVSLIFYGLILVCILYLLLPLLAEFLAVVLAWPMRYVLFTAKIMASIPLAAVYTQSVYIVAWLIFIYILLGVFLVTRNRKPGMLICCGILGLCIALLASWTEPLLDSARITMLDVGQGQSIVLQSEGRTWLVDCGGDDDAETADIISEQLLSQGISRLDGIILTHYDQDHSGALNNLLTRISTDRLILPDTRNDFSIPETDAEILWVWEDIELTFGCSRMVVYGPVYSGMDNENSLCVLFDTEKCDILITGDRTDFGERMLMRNRILPDVDILVAGHHGAADSTSEQLLSAVTPETVLISVKQDNYYGHPSDVLLNRLERFGCTVYRTDKNGTILIRR
ncbi:MAG: DNA internalization-related competence protein ComEC/Rec2 [Oscillospiraceae bacterium]|nr:DNA internalization-related competence protein ComEC/Rec2 [Oscillospiraceae bacterium]